LPFVLFFAWVFPSVFVVPAPRSSPSLSAHVSARVIVNFPHHAPSLSSPLGGVFFFFPPVSSFALFASTQPPDDPLIYVFRFSFSDGAWLFFPFCLDQKPFHFHLFREVRRFHYEPRLIPPHTFGALTFFPFNRTLFPQFLEVIFVSRKSRPPAPIFKTFF